MVCVYCSAKTVVSNSRATKNSTVTWRRRTCTSCRAVATSLESYDYTATHRVRNKDGSLQPFYRDRLFIDVHQSLLHRKAAYKDATVLTDTIVQQIIGSSSRGLIDTSTIINQVLRTLSHFDAASATHYRAHHGTG
jgi:transcriptional regulator NrdR family protein